MNIGASVAIRAYTSDRLFKNALRRYCLLPKHNLPIK